MIHASYPIVNVISYTELPTDTDLDVITTMSAEPGMNALPGYQTSLLNQ
jgi:hypothetical protein